jgi:ABC-type sugar transport system permease subunit
MPPDSPCLPYLLLLPATLFLCVFFLYPFLQIAVLAASPARTVLQPAGQLRRMAIALEVPDRVLEHHPARGASSCRSSWPWR